MSVLDEIRARHEAGERASAVEDREWLLGEHEWQAEYIGRQVQIIEQLRMKLREEPVLMFIDTRGADLITSLRDLAASKHDDLSVATEAAHEIERQAKHVAELQQKIDAEMSCGCSYDAPGDVCSWHSPALAAAQAEVKRLREERNHLLTENMKLHSAVGKIREALEGVP